jgi:hypothetical protein
MPRLHKNTKKGFLAIVSSSNGDEGPYAVDFRGRPAQVTAGDGQQMLLLRFSCGHRAFLTRS